MAQPPKKLAETASQTAGPYVHIGLAPGAAGFEIYDRELGWDIVGPSARGSRIRVEGMVFDGTGEPVKDVLLEVWQANADGNFAHPDSGGPVEDGFRGWGRAISDFDSGLWSFETIKPGTIAISDGVFQAPHLSLWIVARGINLGLHTRLYFDDEDERNAADPVLSEISDLQRRNTLIAQRSDDDALPVYRFDIRLQGDKETVFFDV